jgi:methylated-DNA-[protein]-cysteine S-methyltransferase
VIATERMELQFGSLDSPIGTILVACHGQSLCAVEFADHNDRMLTELWNRFRNFRRLEAHDPGGVCTRLRAYFNGAVDALDAIVVDAGGTAFQRKVWVGLRRIAAGEVATYGELAQRLGVPTAVRAVGYANSLNPINIVVPCHRVIGADGSLTGYSGGLERKAWLLEHEGVAVESLARRVAATKATPHPAGATSGSPPHCRRS